MNGGVVENAAPITIALAGDVMLGRLMNEILYAVDPALRNDRSFLFILTLDRSGVIAIDLTPVLIAHRQVNRAAGDDFRDACRTMLHLSMELGTRLEERPGGLRLALR